MKLQRPIVVAFLALVIAGCNAPYPPVAYQSVGLKYASGHRPSVIASGFFMQGGSDADAILTELHMWLAPASKPFVLVFPDGFRMSDATVSKRLILEHAPSIGRLLKMSGERFVFTPPYGGSIKFTFHADDLIEMSICIDYALQRERSAIAFEAPGGEVLQFPMRHGDLSRLFGEPTDVRRDLAFAWLGC